MNPPLEKTIVAAIMASLKGRGVKWTIKTHGGPYQSSGIPDIIGIAPRTGRFFGIEVKRPGVGRLTDLQRSQIKRINDAGGVAGVAYSVDDALAILSQADEG